MNKKPKFVLSAAILLIVAVCTVLFSIRTGENLTPPNIAESTYTTTTIAPSEDITSGSLPETTVTPPETTITTADTSVSTTITSEDLTQTDIESAIAPPAQSPSTSNVTSATKPRPETTTSTTTAPPATTTPPTTTPPKTTPSKPQNNNFKVVAYFPSWRANHVNKLDFGVVTHAIYAFAIPTSKGELLPLENEALAKQIIKSAHQNGSKVLISVGGWSHNGVRLDRAFVAATKTKEKAKKFAQNIVQLCNDYGFDGVDIDWEFPTYADGTYKQYEWLMQYLDDGLSADKKLLTTAVSGGVSQDSSYVFDDAKAHTDTIIGLVDWVNVMAYDAGDGALHSTYQYAVNSSKYWKNRAGKNKVVLGIPFYSRATGGGYTYGYSYDTIISSSISNFDNDIAYLDGLELHYNGYSTVQKKTQYALENLGGVMIWEIAHDTSNEDYSLLTAIANTIY